MGIQPWCQARAILGKTSEKHASWVWSSQQQLPHSTNKPLMGHTNWHGYWEPVGSIQPCPAVQKPSSSPGYSRMDQPRQFLVCAGSEESSCPCHQAGLWGGNTSCNTPAQCSVPEQPWGLMYVWQEEHGESSINHPSPPPPPSCFVILHMYTLHRSCKFVS